MVEDTYRRLFHQAAGLRGKRMRLLTEIPTDDAGVPQDLPQGITDVISLGDSVTPNLTVRVHPVGDPDAVAYVRFEQLGLYNNQ